MRETYLQDRLLCQSNTQFSGQRSDEIPRFGITTRHEQRLNFIQLLRQRLKNKQKFQEIII